MDLDGIVAKTQIHGDHLDRFALNQQRHHLALPCGQQVEAFGACAAVRLCLPPPGVLLDGFTDAFH